MIFLKSNCEDCKSCCVVCSDCSKNLFFGNIIRCIEGLINCFFLIFVFNYIDVCFINCVKFIRWCKEKCCDGGLCLRIRSLCVNVFIFCCNRINIYCCYYSGYCCRCRFCFENSFFVSCSNCCNVICYCVIWVCKWVM